MMINVLLHPRLICPNLHENDKWKQIEEGDMMDLEIRVFILEHNSNI